MGELNVGWRDLFFEAAILRRVTLDEGGRRLGRRHARARASPKGGPPVIWDNA